MYACMSPVCLLAGTCVEVREQLLGADRLLPWWVLGSELRWSGCVGSMSNQWAISLALLRSY